MDDPIIEAIDTAFRDTSIPAKQTADRLQRTIEHCRTLLNVLTQERAQQQRPPAFANHAAMPGEAGTTGDDEPTLAMEQY